MILPTGLLIAAFLNSWVTSVWAVILAAMSLVGIVLAIITGLTSPVKDVALEGSAS